MNAPAIPNHYPDKRIQSKLLCFAEEISYIVHRQSIYPQTQAEERCYRGFRYTSFRYTNVSTPRICIIAKGIKFTPMQHLSTGDLMDVATSLRDNGRLIFTQSYLPHDSKEVLPPREVRALVD